MKNTQKNKGKSDGAFMKACVIAVFIIVTVYAFAHLVLSFLTGAEISPESSRGFYLFFAGEAGLLTIIKRMKNKKQKDDEESEGENDGEYNDVDFSDDHAISD